MKAGRVFFGLQLKKYTKMFPVILGKSVVFAALICACVVMAIRILGAESSFSEIAVAVVSQEEDTVTDMLVNFVGAMDSFEEKVSFQRMSEKAATASLKRGDIYAAVYLPSGVLEGILNGSNIPAKVVLSRSGSEMETAVFEEVAKAGGKMLSVAQAGIYAADALCVESGRRELLGESEDYLNNAYLDYALNRTAIFDMEEVSAVGKVSLLTHYVIAMLFAFLSFAGVIMGSYGQVKPTALSAVLTASGLGYVRQYVLEVIAFSAVFALAGGVLGCPFLVYCVFMEGMGSAVIPVCILFAFFLFLIGIFIRMILEITGGGSGGMGCAVVLLLVMMFLCGMFVPSAFLPLWAEQIGQILPYHMAIETLVCTMQDKCNVLCVMALTVGALVCLFFGAAMYLIRGMVANREADKR